MTNERFRFRAWNKETKTMHYEAEQTYDCMTGTPLIYNSSFGDILEDEDYIVEQCTGLRDKNGKLIYEGDLIGGNVYPGTYVGYCDKCKSFELFADGDCLSCFDDLDWHLVVEEDGNLEVVGNIHENLELLKNEPC